MLKFKGIRKNPHLEKAKAEARYYKHLFYITFAMWLIAVGCMAMLAWCKF